MESNKLSDEDWSIISSSSDVDEDQAIFNSMTSVNIQSENDSTYLVDKSVSSFATLKIPKMSSSNSHGQVSNTQGKKSASNTTSRSTRVIQNIRFYENLSRLNNSIKKTSNDFYQNIARSKLQQFNNYIQSKDDFEVCVKGDSSSEDKTIETTVDSQPPNKVSSFSKTSRDKFVHAFSCMFNCLEKNSEYLFYYLIAAIITLCSSTFLYYQYSDYLLQSKEIEKNSISLDYGQRLYRIWDKMIYDREESTSYLYGIFKTHENTKSLKALRIYNKFKKEVLNEKWDQAKIFFDTFSIKAIAIFHKIRNQTYQDYFCSKISQLKSKQFYIETENKFNEIYGKLNLSELIFLSTNSLKESFYLVSNSVKELYCSISSFSRIDLFCVLSKNSLKVKKNIDNISILIYQKGYHFKKEIISLFR